jgi:hypothetical protein
MMIMPVTAEDEEISVNAGVNVIDGNEEVFGDSIRASHYVVLPRNALGEPDGFSAWILYRGWVEIKLAETVPDCDAVTIWAGYLGWQRTHLLVYVSPDGKKWKLAGNIQPNSPGIDIYTLSGEYGNVRYIKVKCGGSRWTLGMLDAVSAKGGDI